MVAAEASAEDVVHIAVHRTMEAHNAVQAEGEYE